MAKRAGRDDIQNVGSRILWRSAVLAVAFALLPLTAYAQSVNHPGAASAPAAPAAIQPAQARPVTPDERFWSTIKTSSLPDLFEMFIKRHPDSARRPEAEARLAALQKSKTAARIKNQEQAGTKLKTEAGLKTEGANPITTGSTPPTRSAPPRAAPPVTKAAAPASVPTRPEIMVIQAELLRVGCFVGSVDGIWGPKSQAAAGAFARSAGLEGPVAQPSLTILNALRQTPGRVCTQTASVRKAKPAVRPARRGPARESNRTREQPAPKQTGEANGAREESWAKSFLDSMSTNARVGGGGGW